MSKKNPTRPERWEAAAAKADEGLSELVEIQLEYQEWLDSLPEGLDMTPVAEKLEEVCALGLEEAQSTVQECIGFDLPLGFGRD